MCVFACDAYIYVWWVSSCQGQNSSYLFVCLKAVSLHPLLQVTQDIVCHRTMMCCPSGVLCAEVSSGCMYTPRVLQNCQKMRRNCCKWNVGRKFKMERKIHIWKSKKKRGREWTKTFVCPCCLDNDICCMKYHIKSKMEASELMSRVQCFWWDKMKAV